MYKPLGPVFLPFANGVHFGIAQFAPLGEEKHGTGPNWPLRRDRRAKNLPPDGVQR